MIKLILTIACLLGNYLNCKKIVICFYIWIICNIGWTIIDIIEGSYSRAVLDTVQIAFSIYGIRKWKEKEKEKLL